MVTAVSISANIAPKDGNTDFISTLYAGVDTKRMSARFEPVTFLIRRTMFASVLVLTPS